jgi:hypothetical protein
MEEGWSEDDGQVRGVLALGADRCIYIDGNGSRWLAAFGPGATWDPSAQGVRVGDLLFPIGSEVTFGGGESMLPDAIRWRQKPEGCDVTLIWVLAHP